MSEIISVARTYVLQWCSQANIFRLSENARGESRSSDLRPRVQQHIFAQRKANGDVIFRFFRDFASPFFCF